MNMNAYNVSLQTQSASIRQNFSAAHSTPPKVRDKDGDYDHGTGQDDAKTKSLQMSAQPNLGTKINIRA